MNNSTISKTQKSILKFSVGENIGLSLKGFYRVDAIDSMDFAGSSQEVYILENVLEKTIHKTYLPVNAAGIQGARKLVSEKEIKIVEERLENFELNLEPLDNNSNKKMIAYEKRVKEGGFWEMVQVYLNVSYDLDKTKRLDKRYVAFKERVKDLICGEMTLALGISKEAAEEKFSTIQKVATSH